MFVTLGGTALDPANLLKAFKRHLNLAGLPAMRFHDLRHSVASMMLADGLPLNVVSEILRHSLTSTMVDIYAHVAPAAPGSGGCNGPTNGAAGSSRLWSSREA